MSTETWKFAPPYELPQWPFVPPPDLGAGEPIRYPVVIAGGGLAGLTRAEQTGRPLGPYVIQAGIAACHARARSPQDTDWARIADLYAVLASVWPSPVVELNRAVAVGYAAGPTAGLEILQPVLAAGQLGRAPLRPLQLLGEVGDLTLGLLRGVARGLGLHLGHGPGAGDLGDLRVEGRAEDGGVQPVRVVEQRRGAA